MSLYLFISNLVILCESKCIEPFFNKLENKKKIQIRLQNTVH